MTLTTFNSAKVSHSSGKIELIKNTNHRRRRLSSLAVALNKLDHSCQRAVPIVVLDLVVLSVQLDGGERADLRVLELVGGRVNLGDDHILVFLEVLAERIVDRDQLLAVAAPGGENINIVAHQRI